MAGDPAPAYPRALSPVKPGGLCRRPGGRLRCRSAQGSAAREELNMDEILGKDLIYDWNVQGEAPSYPRSVLITDETLRDGLQSPSVTHPPIQDKVYLLYLMRDLGIDAADLGLCGAGERFKQDVVVLAREIANQHMSIQPQSAARTLASDIEPIIEASNQAGIAIEACIFLGSSPIRQYAEGWELATLLRLTREAVGLAVRNGLPVVFGTGG